MTLRLRVSNASLLDFQSRFRNGQSTWIYLFGDIELRNTQNVFDKLMKDALTDQEFLKYGLSEFLECL